MNIHKENEKLLMNLCLHTSQILIFELEIQKDVHEKRKKRIVSEYSSSSQLSHINGVIEGLEIAIKKLRNIITINTEGKSGNKK